MRRKFKKAVTLLASLTISVSQIRTPAMAENVEKDTQKEVVKQGETIDTNNGEICINYGTVKDNSSNIGENKGKVEDNKGSVKTNEGTIDTNHENAEVGVNTGEIGTNKGLVGSDNRNETINHGTIDKNETHLEINAGKNDTRKLDWDDEKKAAYTGGTIKDNNSDVSINNGTIESNNKKGSVEENNGTITENYGSVTDNNNGAVIDDNQGTVTNNYGKINENNDEVSNNFGEVTENNGNISINDEGGNVKQNLGTIGTNDNGGFVDRNYGSIEENGENGQVSINIGNIEQNYGLVGRYSEDLDPDNLTSKDVDESIPTGLGNFGEITENYGIITKNAGKDDAKHADLSSDDLEDFEGGNVGTNTGLIIINNGTVECNEEDGLIFENNGTVNENTATVTINSQSGIVANYEGGVVEKNIGKVYNYGGVIKDKSTGTEYFSVSITSGSNMSRSGGSNLVKYEDDLWLGQTGTDLSYTEITITPFSDFALSTIKVPDSLKDNVSVSRNRDGSWTIRVTSGTNIALSIPNAIYLSPNSDSDDDGGTTHPGTPNTNNTNNLVPKNGQNEIPPVKDNFDNILDVNLFMVLKPLTQTAALNNFTSPVSTANIQGYGMIDLDLLFSKSIGNTVSVPVAANVLAGSTYTIRFNNGDERTVQCYQNGQILIPVSKGTKYLTFIVYGEALTPSTGNEQSEFGPTGSTGGEQSSSKEGPATKEQTQYSSAPQNTDTNQFGIAHVTVDTGSDTNQALNGLNQRNADNNEFKISHDTVASSVIGSQTGPVTVETGGGNDTFYLGNVETDKLQSKNSSSETGTLNLNTFSVSSDELQQIENAIKNFSSQAQGIHLYQNTTLREETG